MKEFLITLGGVVLLLVVLFAPALPSGFQFAAVTSFDRNLYFGLRSDPVVTDLQNFLTGQKFYSGPVSGNFFSLTLQAVKNFQQAKGVSPTGYFGPLSRAIANDILKKIIGSSGNIAAPQPMPQITISAASVYPNNPATEYITLQNNDYENKQKADISGLKLKNGANMIATIGRDEYGNSIALGYGESAAIVTGTSPLGKNFKINKCSGYLNQQNNISPGIYGCSSLSSLPLPRNLNSKCLNYIGGLGCSSPNINFNTGIDNDCIAFITQHASYAGCVADHGKDSDFDKHEWRIYLGRGEEMWANRNETIQLLDSSGKVITQTSY